MTTHELTGYSSEQLPLVRIINFSHPLTAQNIVEIQKKILNAHLEVVNIDVQADRTIPLMETAAALVASVPLTATQWCEPLIVNPPGLSPLALCVLFEVQRRCGYQPDFLAIRPIQNGYIRGFEVGEIVTAPSSWWNR